MSLSPLATITLGNLRYDLHASEVVARLTTLPGVNSFRTNLPLEVEISATPGDPGSLELDGGEGAETVLTGKVRSLQRRLLETDVSASDAGADLANFRPAATYEKQGAKDVIRALAGEIGVNVNMIDLDLPLSAYVAHQGRTAAEHIAYLARLAGAIATIDSDGELQVKIWPGETPEVALLYGREIITYEVREGPEPRVSRIAVGAGPAGTTDAPDALQHTSTILPGNAPDPGSEAVWSAVPILRTPDATQTASQAMMNIAAANSGQVWARCFLLPFLRPGVVVEVQELPDGLSGGPWTLTQVTHRLRPGVGGTTEFNGVLTGNGSLSSLLGAAASALGGLL